jgi:hypothetical protein
MIAKRQNCGNSCHVLPAYQLRAYARQLTFLPLGMTQKQGLSDNQPEHRIT